MCGEGFLGGSAGNGVGIAEIIVDFVEGENGAAVGEGTADIADFCIGAGDVDSHDIGGADFFKGGAGDAAAAGVEAFFDAGNDSRHGLGEDGLRVDVCDAGGDLLEVICLFAGFVEEGAWGACDAAAAADLGEGAGEEGLVGGAGACGGGGVFEGAQGGA